MTLAQRSPMARYSNKIGRPGLRIKATYGIGSVRRTPRGWIGLVMRRRSLGSDYDLAYMVVRSPHPLAPNGTLLRHLPAVIHSTGRFESRVLRYGRTKKTTMTDPRTWFSNLADAQAAYHAVVQRGGL